MLLLRIVGLLTVIAIGAGILAFLFTRDQRYLSLAWRIGKWALVFVLALFALLIFERLVVLL